MPEENEYMVWDNSEPEESEGLDSEETEEKFEETPKESEPVGEKIADKLLRWRYTPKQWEFLVDASKRAKKSVKEFIKDDKFSDEFLKDATVSEFLEYLGQKEGQKEIPI